MSDRPESTTSAWAADYDEARQALRQLRERLEIIEEIRSVNPGASPQFLAEFSTEDLADYRAHLRHARDKHIRLPGWVQRRTAALAEVRRTLRKAA